MAGPAGFRHAARRIFLRLNRPLHLTSFADVYRSPSAFALGLALWFAGLSACEPEPSTLRIASPNLDQFGAVAYPILLRDCGFPACHGATDRFFSLYGPGRTRLAAEADPSDPATPEEIQHSYDRARSMIDVHAPARSLLLRKPLASAAGGSGHKGDDSLGRNVYQTATDPNFQALRAWVFSQGNAPDAGAGL